MSDAVGGRGIGCQIGRTSPCTVSQGKEWLSRALYEMRKEELRVLATAGGVETRSGKAWLPVAELRSSLMEVLEPSTEVGFNQKMSCDMSCFCDRI